MANLVGYPAQQIWNKIPHDFIRQIVGRQFEPTADDPFVYPLTEAEKNEVTRRYIINERKRMNNAGMAGNRIVDEAARLANLPNADPLANTDGEAEQRRVMNQLQAEMDRRMMQQMSEPPSVHAKVDPNDQIIQALTSYGYRHVADIILEVSHQDRINVINVIREAMLERIKKKTGNPVLDNINDEINEIVKEAKYGSMDDG